MELIKLKEQIYTIPVNEAFDEKCGCPFCNLYLKLEKNRVEYTLGASMMEPDARILSNSMGFCTKHFDMLLKIPNKLSLALVLDTHLQEVRKKISANKSIVENGKKKGLFSKGESAGEKLAGTLDVIESTCVICSQITETMNRYSEVFFYMFENDNNFKKKFDETPYFCLSHYKMLVRDATKYLSSSAYESFIKTLFEKQEKAFEALNEDVHKFTLKFDYRNKDMPWGTAKTAPKRCVYALGSQMYPDDEMTNENVEEND